MAQYFPLKNPVFCGARPFCLELVDISWVREGHHLGLVVNTGRGNDEESRDALEKVQCCSNFYIYFLISIYKYHMPSYVCILHRLKCKNNSVNKRNFETYRATYLGGYPSLCGTYPILYLYIYIYPHVIQSGQVARTTQSVQTLGDSSCNFSLSTGLSTTYWECYSCFPLTAVAALNKEKLVHVGSAFNQKKTKKPGYPQRTSCQGLGLNPVCVMEEVGALLVAKAHTMVQQTSERWMGVGIFGILTQK